MHATASTLIPLNSSRRAESNELSPSSGAPLAGELSLYLTLLTATGMPPLRALYHSIRLVSRIRMVCFQSRSDRWLGSYLLVCTCVHRAGTYRLFDAECYKHATASSLILFDSSRQADSNGPLADSIRHLAEELSSTLYCCFPDIYLQSLFCHRLQAYSRSVPYTSSDPYIFIALINKPYSLI